jgi:1-aminocyclopropane-1-carboxylate deaminase
MHLFPGVNVDIAAATADKVQLPVLTEHGVALSVLRLDKIHPVISGNKWFKLVYHLQEAQQSKAEGLLTFGGAYSNHIIAVACAAAGLGLKSIGIIRGERPRQLSHTLQEAIGYGMLLDFASRASYKTKTSADFTGAPAEGYAGYYVIPEGGSSPLGIKGSAEILNLVNKSSFSHILCATGTATMFRGIAHSALPGQQAVIGIPVLKGEDGFQAIQLPYSHILTGYHFGGYARKTTALLDFMNYFYDATGIPTDFVYTGKLLFATLDLVKKGYFPRGSQLLVIHSGGLQGNRSLPAGTLHF